MQTDEIISHAKELINIASDIGEKDYAKFRGFHARTSDFFINCAGKSSPFLSQISFNLLPSDRAMAAKFLTEILSAYIAHLESGFVIGLSPKRQAEIDVTSDFLDQAQNLLKSNKVHPAAPTVLIGASLEEFLRNWVEDCELSIGNKNPSLEAYSTTLREAELITKQDVKDITAWSGMRNNAAHGEWSELSSKERVRLMLDGVNLFMRKYT